MCGGGVLLSSLLKINRLCDVSREVTAYLTFSRFIIPGVLEARAGGDPVQVEPHQF